MRKRGKELLILALLLLPALVTVLPLFLLLTGSLMDVQEIQGKTDAGIYRRRKLFLYGDTGLSHIPEL